MNAISLRNKTAQVRRQHILEAAARVFAARGFHRATIRDIAVEARVSDGTIYNVFENKTALLRGLLDPLNEAESSPAVLNLAAVPKLAPVVLEDILHEMLRRRWATYTPQTLEILRIVLSEVLVDAELRASYLDQIVAPALGLPEALFEALIADGQIRRMDVPLLLRTLTASVLGLMVLRLVGEPESIARWDDMPDHLTDLLIKGLRPRHDEGVSHGAA